MPTLPLSRLILLGCSLSITLSVWAASQENTINGETISADFPYQSRYIDVLGSSMHYVDEGQGSPVLFIHGNPTSSYLWRNVIPHVAGDYRAIAIDLIGMGKSDKPDIDYTYLDHRRYVNAFIEALGLEDITFVIHDWGTVLGLDYAMNNEANTAGVAFMEALIPPGFPSPNEPDSESLFGRFRTEGPGEQLIYEEHYFVEQMLPNGVIRELSETEMDYYREPYRAEGTRRPILQWPRELPMGGTPATNVEVVTAIGNWMQRTHLPMLYFWANGRERTAEYYIENVANIETHFLGNGRHYLQEDHPESIGRAVSDWRRRID
ncbi:MAG: haloalkane dehalogenase [Pseudohongiellaceae bacterium]